MEENTNNSLEEIKISCSVHTSQEYEIDTVIERLRDLETCGLLRNNQVSFLIEKYNRTWSTNRKQLTDLLIDIRSWQNVTTNTYIQIILILRVPEIHEKLRTYFSRMPGHPFRVTAVIHNSQFLRNLLFDYKSQCDNNKFQCRKVKLQEVFNSYSFEAQNAETIEMKGKWLNARTIIMSLLIQQHIEEHEIEQHITGLTEQLPSGVDTTLPQLLEQCKLSIMFAKRQDWGTATQYMAAAIAISERYSDTTIRYLVQHHNIYLHQIKLEENNSRENRQQAHQVCQRTLDMIVIDKQDNFSVMVYRTFCLYSVFIALRVGPYYEIDTTTRISREDMEYSKQMLERVEVSFNDDPYYVEDRRKIMFNILKARLCQLNHRKRSALNHIEEAECIMARGTPYPREITNLKRFKERLQIESPQWTETTEVPPPNILSRN